MLRFDFGLIRDVWAWRVGSLQKHDPTSSVASAAVCLWRLSKSLFMREDGLWLKAAFLHITKCAWQQVMYSPFADVYSMHSFTPTSLHPPTSHQRQWQRSAGWGNVFVLTFIPMKRKIIIPSIWTVQLGCKCFVWFETDGEIVIWDQFG